MKKDSNLRVPSRTLSDDKELNKLIYTLAKRMLTHRNGTLYEDMYWIDYDECEVVAKEIDSQIERKIIYSDATKKVIDKYKNAPDKTLITIHSHPSSFPPSIDDFMANYDNDYEAQINAINEIQKNFDIMFKEVVAL